MIKVFEKKFGTVILNDGQVLFNFWAPDAKDVKLCIKKSEDYFYEISMEKDEEGWYSVITNKASAGSEYMYKIDGGLMVPDPTSRCQAKDVHDPSVVIDPSRFDWEDDINWKGRPWQETVLYELHPGTFTQEGTFKAIENKLDYLVSLGVTAIELMPVSDFPGKRNWGYDGVLHFAPDRSYGHPDDLKNLIKAAHKKGLMVFLDVVYNHFGPDGNYLYVYAKSKFFEHKHKTPWGDAINFENRHVRNFFIQNAVYWLEEYHFDGLRLDAVHAIKDDSPVFILDELAQTVRERIKDRDVHLVLENDDNVSKFLQKKNDNKGYYEAQWNDDFHHCMHIQLTGETGGYYKDYTAKETGKTPTYFLARCMAEGFAYQGEVSAYRDGEIRGEKTNKLSVTSFVNFIQNHDQIGNRAFGERIASLAPVNLLKASACIYLLTPGIPLLYMGEEWGSKTPFMFFCNFGEELSDSVRDGRRREFSRFPEFSDPANMEKIPDPTIEKTFKNSILNWKDLDDKQHQEMLEFYKNMLKARHEHIVPLIPYINHSKTTFEVLSEGCFSVKWHTDDNKTLEVAVNLSLNKVKYDINMTKNIIAKYATTEKTGELTAGSVYWLIS